MEALARLEEEWGTPGYQSEEQEHAGEGMEHENGNKKKMTAPCAGTCCGSGRIPCAALHIKKAGAKPLRIKI